jgi:ubiquinone/menaquinone biosynthesis C-methylase UbiE
MVQEAIRKTPKYVEIEKINGTDIPFPSNSFDIVFSVTVLQHNTDEDMLKSLMDSICRVSRSEVYLFERTESQIKGNELNLGRPVKYYEDIMKKGGFVLSNTEYLNIQLSYLMAGSIRKGLNFKERKEGEPLNSISIKLQNLFLPITSKIDPIIRVNRGLTMMRFVRL